MALTDYYIAPSTGNDSNAGTSSGAAWKTLQHAVATIVQGAGGDRINYIETASDVLTATPSLSAYGTPSATKPFIITGSGVVGVIDGNASFGILAESKGFITIQNMRLTNVGAHAAVSLTGSGNSVLDCEVDTNSGANQLVTLGLNALIAGCYFHDEGTTYTASISGGSMVFNRFKVAGNGFGARAVGFLGYNTFVLPTSGNSATAIATGAVAHIVGNSIYCNAGTGKAISISDAGSIVQDNVIEGFSGAGGKGIDGTVFLAVYGNNFFYNNTTNNNWTGVAGKSASDHSLSGSPYTNPSASPADLSLNNTAGAGASVRAAAMYGPYLGNPFTSYRDGGAIQHQDAGGGGGGLLLHSGMTGGLRG